MAGNNIKFEIRFPIKDILKWSKEYSYNNVHLEKTIMSRYIPKVKKRHSLNRKEFLEVCRWKTPRSQSRCMKNSESFIAEVSKIALDSPNEEMALKILTLLEGVQYPTASVILHFFHNKKYPILDFRALWSLKSKVPTVYTYAFWIKYVNYCRFLSHKSGLDMRTIDRALWAYSKKNQRTKRK